MLIKWRKVLSGLELYLLWGFGCLREVHERTPDGG